MKKVRKKKFLFLAFRENLPDISQYEKDYNIKFPPVFKLFLTIFEPWLNNYYVLREEGIKDDNNIAEFEFSTLEGGYSPIMLLNFWDVERLFEWVKEFEDEEEWEQIIGIIHISEHPYGGGIVVGKKESNFDKIFEVYDSEETNFLANNIFTYLSRYAFFIEDEWEEKLDFSSLYRNWSEAFWRIGSENSFQTDEIESNQKTVKTENDSFLKLLFRNEILDISVYEERNMCKVPSFFKIFLELFEPFIWNTLFLVNAEEKDISFLSEDAFFREGEKYTPILHPFKNIMEFFECEKSLGKWEKEEGLMHIARHPEGGELLVGIKENNEDKIFHKIDSEVKCIAENIFFYLREYILTEEKKWISKINFNSLYKNWNEDFWRLKK